MKRSICVALAGLLFATAAVAEDDALASRPIVGPLYVIEGGGGNVVASIGPDGILIVDDQVQETTPQLRAELEKLAGGKARIPRFILNTHWHPDHAGGNPEFGKSGVIVAQSNVRQRLSQTQAAGGYEFSPLPKSGWPVVTFDESLSVHWNGEEIRLLHLPAGHTDGDSVVLFVGSNVLHTGDLFFNGLFPYIDVDSGGSLAGYEKNVAKMLELLPAGAKIVPGHGAVATRKELEEFQTMIRETKAIVRERVAAGKSLETIQAAGLPDQWQSWSHPFVTTEKWIAVLYRGIEAK